MDKQKGLYYGKAPKDEDLITPIYGRPMKPLLFCKALPPEDPTMYFTFVPPFSVAFYLDGGDFELFDGSFIACPRPNWWQRLKIRYKIWRLRRKIRKALAKR